MNVTVSTLFIFHVSCSKSGVIDSLGTYTSTCVCMHVIYNELMYVYGCYKCISMLYIMNSPFEGWHMVVTLVWWNKNLDSCPNSTMEISRVTTIVSLADLFWCKTKRREHTRYTLKVSSNSFMLDKDRLAIQSLKGSLAVLVITLVKAI